MKNKQLEREMLAKIKEIERNEAAIDQETREVIEAAFQEIFEQIMGLGGRFGCFKNPYDDQRLEWATDAISMIAYLRVSLLEIGPHPGQEGRENDRLH